jgi:hypothetical protein
MSTLTIYDSQGNPVGDSGAQQNQQIEEFFFDGVKLLIDTSDGYELTLFFRARESETGRAEQYYAVYETEKSTGLFERFEQKLRQEVEETHGMILETATDDTPLPALLTTEPPLPETEKEQSTISLMLSEGKQLTLGVDSPKAAFALVRHYFGSQADRIVILDDISTDTMLAYDFAIEYGSYSGIESIGEGTDAFNEHLRRTTANSARPRATSTGIDGGTGYANRVKSIGKESLAVAFGAVLMAALLVLAANGAAIAGLDVPVVEQLIFLS